MVRRELHGTRGSMGVRDGIRHRSRCARIRIDGLGGWVRRGMGVLRRGMGVARRGGGAMV